MSSQVEIKRAFNKLKHELEPYRDIIVQLDTLLTWEQNYFPAIIFGVLTVFFLILWGMNLSVMTLCALTGMNVIAFDYAYPFVARFFYNPDNWSGEQEERFESVCNQICNIKMTIVSFYDYIFNNPERKSPFFKIITFVVFFTFAWIGAVIDNLLLMYFITLGLAMYPGISSKNVFAMIKEKGSGLISSKIEKIKDTCKKTE